jgi:hypothetical protein
MVVAGRSLPVELSADAVAALRAHPHFQQAVRRAAGGLVALYQGNRLLNLLINDRGRLLISSFALYLHFGHDSSDQDGGLTLTRIQDLCIENSVCSRGRAAAMVALMRATGYLATAPVATGLADRRVRRLVPTERLIDSQRQNWRCQFGAIALLRPEGAAAFDVLGNPDFIRALLQQQGDRFRAGVRILDRAPTLSLFAERNAGMMILFSLLLAGAAEDAMPASRPVPISISALARRFGVSRPHVLKLLRDAAHAGLIERKGANGEQIVLSVHLAEATLDFLATVFLFLAHCAREADGGR